MRLPLFHTQIPGRMSDSAVAGAGAYADSAVGACGSTGDGDIHLRFLPLLVEGPCSVLPSLRGSHAEHIAAQHDKATPAHCCPEPAVKLYSSRV